MKKILYMLMISFLILTFILPASNANAAWYISMKSTFDKSGYETVTAKKTVYGSIGDTVAVFEGLTSNTKIISIKSSNTGIFASVNYYTDQGIKQYSILAKCITATKLEESATITVKCYSKKKKKNYTRKLFVTFQTDYQYDIDRNTGIQLGNSKKISLKRTSTILSQKIKYYKFHMNSFFYDSAPYDKICTTSLSKTNSTLSLKGTKLGSLNMKLTTKYADGEIIKNSINVNINDTDGCIADEEKNVVIGNPVYILYKIADHNAKLTVTGSDDSILKCNLQIRTLKDIAKAYHYKLSAFDDPESKMALLYFDGIKEGISTVYVTYSSADGETIYKYRYPINVFASTQAMTTQSVNFVMYENDILYEDVCYIEDLSGNVLQRIPDITTIAPDTDNVYYTFTMEGQCNVTLNKDSESHISVTIKDLFNKKLTQFTKTFLPTYRNETESTDIIFKTKLEAIAFISSGDGRWYGYHNLGIVFKNENIKIYDTDSDDEDDTSVPIDETGYKLDNTAVYSFDINKKLIKITDESYTTTLPYRIISNDQIIIKYKGKWTLFAKNLTE